MTSGFHRSLTTAWFLVVSKESDLFNHLSKVLLVLPWWNKTNKMSVVQSLYYRLVFLVQFRQTFDT